MGGCWTDGLLVPRGQMGCQVRHQLIKETLFTSVILLLMDTSWDIKQLNPVSAKKIITHYTWVP